MAEIRVDIEELKSVLAQLVGLKEDILAAEKKASSSVKKVSKHCGLGYELSNSLNTVDRRTIELANEGIAALQMSILTYQTVDAALGANAEKIKTPDVPGSSTSGNQASRDVVVSEDGTVSIHHTEVVEIKGTGKGSISNSEAKDYIDSINPPQQVQIRSTNSSGFNGNNGGVCNISSVTTLWNRKYALEYGQQANDYLTPEDAFSANGCNVINHYGIKTTGDHRGQDYYQYTGGTGGWANGVTYSNGSGVEYTTHNISANSARNEVNNNYGGSYPEYIAHLLEEHPEGICIRNQNSNHVAVITGYTRDANNSISLQVEDPVGTYKGSLEGSWLYKNDSDKSNFWNHLDKNIALTYIS